MCPATSYESLLKSWRPGKIDLKTYSKDWLGVRNWLPCWRAWADICSSSIFLTSCWALGASICYPILWLEPQGILSKFIFSKQIGVASVFQLPCPDQVLWEDCFPCPRVHSSPNVRAICWNISLTGIVRTLSYPFCHTHLCFLNSLLLGVEKEKGRAFILFNSLTKRVFTIFSYQTKAKK